MLTDFITETVNMELFDYWTTWILIAIFVFVYMIKPYLKDSNVRWQYRDDIQLASMAWFIVVVGLLYHIGF